MEIPVVDFASYGLHVKDKNSVDEDALKGLAAEIHKAFTNIGFVYLKNHGLPKEALKRLEERTKVFFELPTETKTEFLRPLGGSDGWVAPEQEKYTVMVDRPPDLKECYNILPPPQGTRWPDKYVSGFQDAAMNVFDQMDKLGHRVLDLIAISLNLEDRDFFNKCHNSYSKNSDTTLRCLFYPRVVDESGLKPNQIGCGEHSDYGSITLLFQDDVGGLEVYTRAGEFMPAKPIPDTVLVNIGDLMQMWTDDELVSTKHRVIIPPGTVAQRQSYAFFLQPDLDFMIASLKGINKYPPITSGDHLNNQVNSIYQF